jgi:hypothetical protein
MSQPSILDLQAPFDITALSEITFAQLQQWLSGTTPYSDKGLIEITADVGGVPQVPNAVTNPKWQNYLWIRQGATTVTAYIWNPSGATDATFLNWVTVNSASIAPGSITGSQIAPNTITPSNISSVLGTQVVGYNTAWLAVPSGSGYSTNGLLANTTAYPSGGLLGGTFGNPTLANASIGPGVLAPQSVSGGTNSATSNVMTGAVTTLQLQNNGGVSSPGSLQQSTAAVDPQANVMVLNKSLVGTPSSSNFSLTASGVAAAPGDLLGVNYDATLNQAGFVQIRKAITTLAEPTASLTTGNQIPYVPVNTVPSGNIVPYSFSNLQGSLGGFPVGRILQQVTANTTVSQSTASTLAMTGTNPTTSNTVLYTGFGAAGVIAFTPQSTASQIIIEIVMQMSNSNSGNVIAAILFNGTTPVASSISQTEGTCSTVLTIRYAISPASISTIDFGVYFIGTSNTTYVNSYQGTATGVAALLTSSYKITEYL